MWGKESHGDMFLTEHIRDEGETLRGKLHSTRGGSTVDIQQHTLVPKHEILGKEEKKELLERLNVDKGRLPKILSTDPVVKQINAKLGDVLKITRKSQTAGTAVYYRIVV